MEEQNKPQDTEKRQAKSLKSIISLPSLIGLIIGSIGGYIYYLKVGCQSDSCPITSDPWLTIIWGAAVGYLIGDMFKRKKRT